MSIRRNNVPDFSKYTNNIPNAYLKVLRLEKRNINDTTSKLYFYGSMESETLNTVSYFIYKKDFFLQIIKLKNNFTLSLKHSIDEKLDDEGDLSLFSSYFEDDDSQVDFQYQPNPIVLNKIHLNLDGRNFKVLLKNDSASYYYSDIKNFSIRYNRYEFGINGKTKRDWLLTPYLSMEIMFLVQDRSLYLIILSDFKYRGKFRNGELRNLIWLEQAVKRN